MSEQLNIFDAIASRQAAEAGIELAASHNGALLHEAREIAVEIAKREGTVDADRVTKELVNRGYGVRCLGNSAGSLFRDRRFQFTGAFTKATRRQSHSNLLRLWKLAI